MSHNLGSHVITNAKHQIEDLEKQKENIGVQAQLRGLAELMQYLQERQDFIAVIANSEHYPRGPLYFKDSVFDVLAMDGPAHRHDLASGQINNYILDNIVRSENITRAGCLVHDDHDHGHACGLAIELQLVKIKLNGEFSAFKSMGGREFGNEFSDLVLSVNHGQSGRQALLTILENIIRNSAKHDKSALKNLENNTLLFSIIFHERADPQTGNAYYEITIADNKRNFAALKPKFERADATNVPIIQNGRLAPIRILREDGGGIARENKGVKEILISLTWLKYGEPLPSGQGEVDYDTLQNAPWEIMDVVGVDDRFHVYDYDAPGQPANLSLGYRFRLQKYKAVHLLESAELDLDAKPLKKALADLPGAALYAVRRRDMDRHPNNKILHAIPRFEVVADDTTEASLQKQMDRHLENNIRRRFGYAESDPLPLLRVSDHERRPYADDPAVIRELQDADDARWTATHAGREFVHYRHHYETRLETAQTPEELELHEDAIFTEGISGGNFTNNLIRVDLDRHAYLRIVEAALTQIAIVDERIFAKLGGLSPEERDRDPHRPDDPRWLYWEQKGVHVLNSDDGGIFDLRGRRISTGVNVRIKYDFLSIHLGLIDKTDAGEHSTEKTRLQAALQQFGAHYVPGLTKLSVHSGRGGMTQVEDVAFIPLSAIEWAMDDCKYTLSEFFHGIKFPPFGEADSAVALSLDVKPRARKTAPPVASAGPARSVSPPPAGSAARATAFAAPARHSSLIRTRPLFLFTTYSVNSDYLYGCAAEAIEHPEIERFAAWEDIRAKASPEVAEAYRHIRHLDSQFFFYPCAKPVREVIAPDRHGEFIQHLVEKILHVAPGRHLVDLHLILHASDDQQRRDTNTQDKDHSLIEAIKQTHPNRVLDVTIWWFSHTGGRYGLHGNILCRRNFFDGAKDKAAHLLSALENNSTPLRPARPADRAAVTQPKAPVHHIRIIRPSGKFAEAPPGYAATRIPDGVNAILPTHLDRLAIWQLNGADDSAALDHLWDLTVDVGDFWNPRMAPERSAERITAPLPLLVMGTKPLSELGRQDRRVNYLDNSIWCRYAANEAEAEAIRARFARHRAMGLFDSSNGREHFEFWARMLVNARFGTFAASGADTGSPGKSGHVDTISPIVFHSEGEMARKTDDTVRRVRNAFANHPASNRPLIWKMLLIDDHALKNISGGKSSKQEVILESLAPLFTIHQCVDGETVPYAPGRSVGQDESPGLKDLCHLRIYAVPSIDEALEKIREQRFDIILLDYLLHKTPSAAGIETDFDTADRLLDAIKDSFVMENANQRGPKGFFWIFNVSAFATAMEGKLRAKGYQYQTNEWHLSRGACPVNTPELFRHNLLSFVLYQSAELSRFRQRNTQEAPLKDHAGNTVEYIGGGSALLDLLVEIFSDNPREAADRHFTTLLNLAAACKVMQKDIAYGMPDAGRIDLKSLAGNPKKSEIVFSLFPDIIHYDEAFWDHLQHLVHGTAYGTPRQWPQLLIHFREIRQRLFIANRQRNEQRVEKLLNDIETYIINLNQQS